MFNCEIELDLSWSRNCVISETSRAAVVDGKANANSSVQIAEEREAKSAKFDVFSAGF